MNTKKKIVTIIAATAAIAFTTAPLTATIANAAHKVKCYGVNSCKGKSKCKTAQNGCKGKNSCKGKGYLMKTEKDCKKMGGSATEPSADSDNMSNTSTTSTQSTGSGQ
jgi:hypothetical protein